MSVARRSFLLALALGFGWGLVRLAFPPAERVSAPVAAAPAEARAVSSTPARPAASAAELPPAGSAPGDGDQRLLREVAALSAEFDRLRALPDDIDNFRRSADLENEFMAMLDAETAAFFVREMPAGFADTHFGVLSLTRWAGADRAGASAWMASHPGATPSSAEALARGWWGEDRPALAAHLDQLPPGAWKTNLAVTAAEDAYLGKEPAEVLALLGRAAPDDARRAQLIGWNATAWATRDPGAASAWAATEPDAATRQRLLAAIAIGEASRDPAAAAERLARTVVTPEAARPAVQAIARLWAVRDPATATRWVNTLPAGLLREEAKEGLLAVVSP